MIDLNLVKFDTGLVPTNDGDKSILNQIQEGEFVNVKIDHSKQRSNIQLNLFMKCCEVIASNTENENFNTKEKVILQLKNKFNFVEYEIYYKDKDSGEFKVIKEFNSLSFGNCDHADATTFMNDSIEHMAKIFKMDVDKFVLHVKSQMCVQKITKTFNGSVVR